MPIGWFRGGLSTPLFPCRCGRCRTQQHRADSRWPFLVASVFGGLAIVAVYAWLLFTRGEWPATIWIATALAIVIAMEAWAWRRVRLLATARGEKWAYRVVVLGLLLAGAALIAWVAMP